MKKITYLLAALVMVFTTACDPMEDVYEEIGGSDEVIVGNTEYELTDGDYEALSYPDGFLSVDDVKTELPSFIEGLYPVWGEGSTVLVNYKMADGLSNLPAINDLTQVDSYYLANSDYPMVDQNAVGFFPNEDPTAYLPAVLATNFPAAVEGDIVLATYKQYVGEVTSGYSSYYEATFDDGELGDFEVINVMGSKSWYASDYDDIFYAKMSAFGDGQNEDWLISPEIDLTNQTNSYFQINQTAPFVEGNWDLITVLVSKDYTTDTDHTAATWEEVTIENMPTGDRFDYDYVLSELVDFSAYDGETIHVAFKYIATEENAPTWQIDFAAIKVPGVEGTTDSRGMYFQMTEGSWEVVEDIYYLSASDFNAMGTDSGQPGKYDNFSNSTPAENYVPTLLSSMKPYAQEEESLIVMYKYFAGGTSVKGNIYTVVDGVWTPNRPQLQFGHDGSKWVPDNTITYTLTTADYDSLGEEWGSPGYYDNFDVRPGEPNFTDTDDHLESINIVLKANFPGAEEGQKFNVFYAVYSGQDEIWSLKVILTNGEYVLFE